MIGKRCDNEHDFALFWDASKKANLQQCMLRVFSVCGFEYVRV